MTEPSADGNSADESQAESAQRPVPGAEQTAEEWGEKIGRWVLRAAARAREEAEDVWAEAQAVRRKL
jgi:hypothetical protein